MAERVIPLVDQRLTALRAELPAQAVAPTGLVADRLGRPLRDLRISVTDRCNFRCSYCMPKEVFDKDYQYLPHASLLSFEEITRVARQFLAHGVRKIRLTGASRCCARTSRSWCPSWRSCAVEGTPPELTLTTNGSLLARKAQALKGAGLKRVTVSLDGMDDAVFRRMNDVDFPVAEVLQGIAAARRPAWGP